MSKSLRDQLLQLGFESSPGKKPDTSVHPRKPAGKGAAPARREGKAKARDAAQIDLGKAFALRAAAEKRERIEAERQRQEEARQRREARARLGELLVGERVLNDPAAEHVRHFEYGGKIKRVHVTEAQLRDLNAGLLGLVQLNGRYLLVSAQTLAEVEAIFAPAVALKIDPNAPAGEDPYADPRYQVPDDLAW